MFRGFLRWMLLKTSYKYISVLDFEYLKIFLLSSLLSLFSVIWVFLLNWYHIYSFQLSFWSFLISSFLNFYIIFQSISNYLVTHIHINCCFHVIFRQFCHLYHVNIQINWLFFLKWVENFLIPHRLNKFGLNFQYLKYFILRLGTFQNLIENAFFFFLQKFAINSEVKFRV